ncbi:hypothetical protein NEOLEDRAFT_1076638 [Neolentinus lepideus HHB14362 ss-1]|uniref:Uncharacterized protein n=1 Tax=Neolentinus lepideus HHB14362 ss-1 TaxID=1314782 RepID=A0A165NR08_9AGAM|nr:hypothetical protein NEOLEDRAFT_1076638 [Neolentinus lepideus HHB14362 ss-1]
MSAASTPLSTGGYGSPSPASGYGHTPSPVPGYSPSPAPSTPGVSKPSASKAKPANVFSNDGSFLERFQRIKREEEEKKKQEEALAKKRNFDDRFRKRGKRATPESSVPAESTVDEPVAKKAKSDSTLTEYERQVKSYGTSLKDIGIGVRPLVK